MDETENGSLKRRLTHLIEVQDSLDLGQPTPRKKAVKPT